LRECVKKIKPVYLGNKTSIFKTLEKKDETKKKKLNIILKTDVLGSTEAIFASLEKFNYPDVGVEVVSYGLGNIGEAEILRAEAVGARIFGFNVLIIPGAEELAREKKVEVKTFNVIYDLLDEIKKDLEKLLEPEIVRTNLGKIDVLAIFRTEPSYMIVGGKVREGKIVFDPKLGQTLIRILRKNEEIGQGGLLQLQSAKNDVREVCFGQECGIKYKGKPIIAVGDILDIYREEKKFKVLE